MVLLMIDPLRGSINSCAWKKEQNLVNFAFSQLFVYLFIIFNRWSSAVKGSLYLSYNNMYHWMLNKQTSSSVFHGRSLLIWPAKCLGWWGGFPVWCRCGNRPFHSIFLPQSQPVASQLVLLILQGCCHATSLADLLFEERWGLCSDEPSERPLLEVKVDPTGEMIVIRKWDN